MRLVVVTGISGAGKTQALRFLEDMGFFCMDNMPPAMLQGLVDLCEDEGRVERAAVTMDARGMFFADIGNILDTFDAQGVPYELLFVDASDDVLIKRFKETRRTHPLTRDGRLHDALAQEREMLISLKERAHHVIDTSRMLTRELQEEMLRLFSGTSSGLELKVTAVSFGFKRGVPLDADLVFDVRFLPNPFYIEGLKEFSGLDQRVKDYVFSYPETEAFLAKTVDMLSYLLPYYKREGKRSLVVAFGCTGGMHRSVALADAVRIRLLELGIDCYGEHRDLQQEKSRFDT